MLAFPKTAPRVPDMLDTDTLLPNRQILSIDFTADVRYDHLPAIRKKFGFATSPVIRAKSIRFPIVSNMYESGAWGATWLVVYRVADKSWRALIVSDSEEPASQQQVQQWRKSVVQMVRTFNGTVTSTDLHADT